MNVVECKNKTSGKKWIKKTRRDSFVWARVSPEERELLEELAKALGLSVAELVRFAILQELDKRSLLTARIQKLKEEFETNKSKGEK
jgi:transposase